MPQLSLSMGHRSPSELLDELRTYLRHFDETGHLGDSETIEQIKRRLRARISEAEAELRSRGQSESAPNPRPE